MDDLYRRAVALNSYKSPDESISRPKQEIPFNTLMSFTEFIAYWKSVSDNPPTDGVATSFRVWCCKRNEWLEEKRTSPYKHDQKKFEQHEGRYIEDKNTLQQWMVLVWEFAAGNSALRAQGRPNFMGPQKR